MARSSRPLSQFVEIGHRVKEAKRLQQLPPAEPLGIPGDVLAELLATAVRALGSTSNSAWRRIVEAAPYWLDSARPTDLARTGHPPRRALIAAS